MMPLILCLVYSLKIIKRIKQPSLELHHRKICTKVDKHEQWLTFFFFIDSGNWQMTFVVKNTQHSMQQFCLLMEYS